MKKLFTLFLMVLPFTILFANGGGEAPAAEGPVSVDFYTWSDGDDTYSHMFDYFNELDKSVKINPKYVVPADYESKLTTLLAGGMSMDLYMQKKSTDIFAQFNNGYIEPLDDLIKKYNYDYSQIAAWDEAIRVDGHVAALPHRAGKYYTFYNVKPFIEKGVPTPTELVEKGEWTWDKFIEISQALSENDGETFGSCIYTWGSSQVYPACQDGMLFLDQDGNVDVNDSFYQSFNMRKVLEEGNDMTKLIELKVTKTHYSQVMYTGMAPMLLIGEWFPGIMKSGFDQGLVQGFTKDDFRVTRLPSDSPEYYSIGNPTFGHIHSKSKNKDAAFEVLSWFASPDGALLEAKEGLLPPMVTPEVKALLAENVTDAKSLEYFTEDVPVRPVFYNKYGSKVEQAVSRFMEKYLIGDISDADLVDEFKKELQMISDTTD